jgi:S-adenosylmethionine:tRNA ribosyltransferase-isomerase
MVDLDSLASYDYNLPPELIAQTPAEPRDSSRLIVLHRASGKWEHRHFRDLPEYFDSKDFFVANNTQVLKARLLGHRLKLEKDRWVPGGKVEFVMLEEKEPLVWEGLFHASAKYLPGLRFEIPTPDGQGLRAELVLGSGDTSHGTVVARFERDPIASGAGQLPLPHYIEHAPGSTDESSYQTVYAKNLGSAAAPTAGLHFTPNVLEALKRKGAGWEEVTLHVGLGTFRPVKVEDVREHKMHDERYVISDETARSINQAKREGRRITAVGTTSVRTLESAAEGKGIVRPGQGRTELFIRPGAYEFKIVDRLLTNFHLPKSTLLMLVCAFAGREFALAAYEEAVRAKYRFFSYGDAMLIL